LDIKGDLSVAKHPTDATSYATIGGILSDSYLSTFKDADQRSAFKMCKGVTFQTPIFTTLKIKKCKINSKEFHLTIA